MPAIDGDKEADIQSQLEQAKLMEAPVVQPGDLAAREAAVAAYRQFRGVCLGSEMQRIPSEEG